MKVILNTDVFNLGEEGDVKDVAAGYARNFLIPRGMVLPYSRQNLALIESRRATIERRKEDKREKAKGARERLESEPLTVKMTAGEKGKLFGSVTSQAIAEQLEKRGIEVERKKIDIEDGTIKMLGTHTVRVRLYGDEEAQLKVIVEPDEKSAPQRTGGGAGKTEKAAQQPSTATAASAGEEPATATAEAEPESSEAGAEPVEAGAESPEAGPESVEAGAEPDEPEGEAVDEEPEERE